MASEIRVNKINNRAGLGTVTYTDTGIVVSGISTATNFKTGSSDLHSSGLTVGNTLVHSTGITLGDNNKIKIGGGGDGYELYHDGSASYIKESGTGNLRILASNLRLADSNNNQYAFFYAGGAAELNFAGNKKFETTNTGAVVTGILTATSFSGDGSSLSNLPAGAPVGGASTNTVFFENDKAVAVNYQITSTKNAMSAGPIAINAGIAVTVPSGCAWTII